MNKHISTNKNLLVLLTILILSSLLNPGCGGTTSPPITVNKTIYRALCVGVGDYMYFPDIYGNIDLPGPPFDVNRVCNTLSKYRIVFYE